MDRCQGVKKRQVLYKNCTPPWKETYRKRCRDRLKASRDKFIERLRHSTADQHDTSLVEDLMQEEWKVFCSEADKQLNKNESIDDYIAIFEEIRAELIREEQQILAEYEAGLHHEEASLQSTIQNQYEVICPVCQRNPLILNKGVIFCYCGIRIETEQDCVSLSYVKQNLMEGLKLHSESCSSQPQFGIVNHEAIQNLLMTCDNCDFIFIIV